MVDEFNEKQTVKNSTAYQVFLEGIGQIEKRGMNDYFHNKLYFINLVSLLEMYLSDVFIHEIKNNRNKLIRLASHDKFRQHKLPLAFILTQDVETYFIHQVQNLLWHRLTDVKKLYEYVLGIQITLSESLMQLIHTRHDLVHRNGVTIGGQKVVIASERLQTAIILITDFVQDIESKYQQSLPIKSLQTNSKINE